MADFIFLVFLFNWAFCYDFGVDDREPPRFQHTNQNVTVYKDTTAVLECVVDHLGPKTVAWRRSSDNYVLSIGTTMYAQNKDMSLEYHRITKSRTQWNLVIKRAQPKHSGQYECQISATYPITYGVFLQVYDETMTSKPDVELNGTIFVSRYQDIRLTCNATGSKRAPDEIDWFYEGTKIDTHDRKWRGRITITKYHPEIPGRTLVSNLIIEHSRYNDRGTYICRSSDLATKSVEVFILNADRELDKREEGSGKLTELQSGNTAKSNKELYLYNLFVALTINSVIKFTHGR